MSATVKAAATNHAKSQALEQCKQAVTCDGQACVDPSKVSFLACQAITFAGAIFSLVLTFNKPSYGSKRNTNHKDCPNMGRTACDEIIVKFLSPIQFVVTPPNTNGCLYSCGFPQKLVEFRGSLACITITLTLGALFVGLRRFVYAIIGTCWFSIFVLDTDATEKGFAFCDSDFEVYDQVNRRTYQYMFPSYRIDDCLVGDFIGVCFMDMGMACCVFSTIILIHKYMAFIVSSHSQSGNGGGGFNPHV